MFRRFLAILRYETRILFLSPATYFAAVLFLFLMGGIYLLILHQFSTGPREGMPTSEFFNLFWIPALFIVPLITMRSVAEEHRTGTLHTLLSTSVSPFAVSAAKFFAAYIFFIMIWALALAFPYTVHWLIPEPSIEPLLFDLPTMIGGFTFVALTGTFYVALGIFASSVTKSQLVAAMLTFILLAICTLGLQALLEMPLVISSLGGLAEATTQYLHPFILLQDFSHGVFDSRPFFLFTTAATTFVILSALIIESKA